MTGRSRRRHGLAPRGWEPAVARPVLAHWTSVRSGCLFKHALERWGDVVDAESAHRHIHDEVANVVAWGRAHAGVIRRGAVARRRDAPG